jgi:ParB family chromosome partitioning protein
MRLLNLPTIIKQHLLDEKIDMGHARALVGCASADEIVDRIINNNLSVRDVENLVKEKRTGSRPEKIQRCMPESVKTRVDELSRKIGLKCRLSYSEEDDSGTLSIKFNSLEQLDDFINKL